MWIALGSPQVYKQMGLAGVCPDTTTFNTLLSACKQAGEGEYSTARSVFREMRERCEVPPDVFTYTALMSVCGEAGKWEHALDLLKEMKQAVSSSS
jgi:pentatricopeptide repeat protein